MIGAVIRPTSRSSHSPGKSSGEDHRGVVHQHGGHGDEL